MWIQTYSGLSFDLENPDPNTVDIKDIAHALSLICRFTGHVKHHYSVAQHSVLVSRQLPQRLRFQGLMHDAHEAYVGDVSAPLKRCRGMEGYRAIENKAWIVVATKFMLPHKLDPSVKEADLRMCVTEKKMLGKASKPWDLQVKPYKINIIPWPAENAEQIFLDTFRRLV